MTRPVTRAEAEALVLLYNRVTVRCPNVPQDGRGQPIGRKVTPTAVKEATAFLRFCVDNGFDPERFIIERHETLGWRTRIPLKELAHVSENTLDHFRAWGEARAAETTRAVAPVEDFDQLAAYPEQLKARYALGPRDLCMVTPDTRGWHPASKWCQLCTVADACRRRLPADRRARREGNAR